MLRSAPGFLSDRWRRRHCLAHCCEWCGDQDGESVGQEERISFLFFFFWVGGRGGSTDTLCVCSLWREEEEK